MPIVFTPEAKSDLDGLRTFLKPRNPKASRRFARAVKDAIDAIEQSPAAGTPTLVADILEATEPRSGYRISYSSKGEIQTILRIHRGNRKTMAGSGDVIESSH